MTWKLAPFALAAGTIAMLAGYLAAGPLSPPAGPVASTYKTLAEVEPRIAINATNTPGDANSLFKITQPGSYYLTGNLTGVASKYGIEIVTSGVSIDLNGFEVAGIAGSLSGIAVSVSPLQNLEVRNGTVRAWGDYGIALSTGGTPVSNCRVQGVRAANNGNSGIVLDHNGTVSDCVAEGNTKGGISLYSGGIAHNSTARGNGDAGFTLWVDGSMIGCTATLNGIYGFHTPFRARIESCTANDNTQDGFNLGDSGSVFNSVAFSNGLRGIVAGSGCSIRNKTVHANATGIFVSDGNTVEGNTVYANTTNGIRANAGCTVRGNTCDSNGSTGDGAGILIVSSDNRIEGNNCTFADRGIDIDAAGNVILRNTCSGNTLNWTIVPGNAVAPIVNATVNAAAINGNTYTGNLGNTDPNANFTY